MNISHKILNSVLPGIIDKRDIVFFNVMKEFPDGKFLILRRSVDHSKAQPKKGVIRALIYVSAILLSPSTTIPGGTDHTRIVMYNVGGKLENHSNWVYSSLAKQDVKFMQTSERKYKSRRQTIA